MPFLLGTDEAGYGPNLGPLTISATLWHVNDRCVEIDLYETLATCVGRSVGEKANGKLPLADSKQLYTPALGLSALEHGVLAALAACGAQPASWRELWLLVAKDSLEGLDAEPWNLHFDPLLPLAANVDEVEAAARSFRTGLKAAGVRLAAVRSIALCPAKFNQLCDEYGTKGSVLSRLTLKLAASLLPQAAGENVHIVCDKHGGRNQYGALLMETMTEGLVETGRESRAESTYRFKHEQSDCEISFRAKGESFLPSALASMMSKYLRELSMLPFNAFWQQHVPGLAPTAGYPGDAKRFKKEIAKAQQKLGIEDALLWRTQ